MPSHLTPPSPPHAAERERSARTSSKRLKFLQFRNFQLFMSPRRITPGAKFPRGSALRSFALMRLRRRRRRRRELTLPLCWLNRETTTTTRGCSRALYSLSLSRFAAVDIYTGLRYFKPKSWNFLSLSLSIFVAPNFNSSGLYLASALVRSRAEYFAYARARGFCLFATIIVGLMGGGGVGLYRRFLICRRMKRSARGKLL